MNTSTLKPTIFSTSVSLLFAATLASVSVLAASESEGPAEKAGQQIDHTTDKAQQAASDAAESAPGKAERAGGYMDDSALTGKVKLAILRDPVLKVLQIGVTTTDGAVTLTGAVDSQATIDRATTIVRDVPDVKSVENSLTVKTPG